MYDIVIVGGGPAGLAAAIYAAREGFEVLIAEKMYAGGQVVTTDFIENYPGFAKGISGYDLCSAMQKQAERFGAKLTFTDITKYDLEGRVKKLTTSMGDVIETKTVIMAMGASHRHLGVPGEMEFAGRGVSYCAICDGAFFKDKKVVVVGGGDSAVEDSMYLSQYVLSVTIVHRRDELRAQKIIQARAFADPKIDIKWNSIVKSIRGKDTLSTIELEDTKTGETSFIDADGLFVLIGLEPNTDNVTVKIDKSGYILTDENMHTSIDGVFAAGDIRKKNTQTSCDGMRRRCNCRK